MPSDKHPHGTTFHQAIILAILKKYGPTTSGQIAAYYKELTEIDIAYNYQYIITRRLADRGLIKAGKATSPRNQKVYRWSLTPRGRRLLENVLHLSGTLNRIR